MVGMIKEIGLPFVAGTRAGTVCHQGEARLHILLLDTTRAATTTTITATTVTLLVLLVLLLLVQMVGSSCIAGCIRDGIG
jgi:hypothetical protein